MEELIEKIQKISGIFPDNKRNVTTEIYSMDLSSLPVGEIRKYVQILKNISMNTLNNDIGKCCTILMMKLTTEEQSRPFEEQFPELTMTVKELKDAATALYAESKAQKETLKNIQKKGKKHDDKLEELINNAVARYFKGTVVLSGYNYKTADDEDGELDGMVVGVDENGKNVVVFIETKSDMNSKWNDATKQMNRVLLHWNYLKELYASNEFGVHDEDIKNFRVESCKDFEIRCAFGADHFDVSTIGQFKQFRRYRWLKVSKNEDIHYTVTRQS